MTSPVGGAPTSPDPSPRPERKSRWRLANVITLVLLLTTILGIGLFLGVYHRVRSGLPPVSRLETWQPDPGTRIDDRNGETIAQFTGESGERVPLDRLPPMLVWAVLAAEDRSFYRHDGIDYRRLVKTATRYALGRPRGRGATTITMQLSGSLVSREGTLKGKFEEMILAREIEQRFSKDEILQMYLDRAYFGNGAYGIGAAARSYFAKPAADLTLPESALLVGILDSPSRDDPRSNMASALARRAEVLDDLVDLGYDRAKAERLKTADVELAPATGTRGANSYFVEYVRGDLMRMIGAEGLWRGGYRVETTLDAELQATAERLVEEHVARVEAALPADEITRAEWRAAGDPAADAPEGAGATRTPYLQGALIAVDVETGGIVALVGGRDYRESAFDRATHARRRAGSVIEPLVLTAAVRQGLPVSQVGREGPLRLPPDVGTRPVLDFIGEAGITTVAPSDSLALEEAEVIPWQLLRAYTIYPSGGERLEPIAIARIEDRNGDLVRAFDIDRTRILTPEQAHLVTTVLQGVVDQGAARTGVRGRGFEGPAAGVPAMAPDATDAWFVGFTPRYAVVTWIGFDDGRPIRGVEARESLAVPIWTDFMKAAHGGPHTRSEPAASDSPL